MIFAPRPHIDGGGDIARPVAYYTTSIGSVLSLDRLGFLAAAIGPESSLSVSPTFGERVQYCGSRAIPIHPLTME